MGKQIDVDEMKRYKIGSIDQIDKLSRVTAIHENNRGADIITSIAWAIIGILLVFCICCLFFIYGIQTARAETAMGKKMPVAQAKHAGIAVMAMCLMGCVTGTDTYKPWPVASNNVSPWDHSMPVRVMADGSFISEPLPNWFPYFGSNCAHVNCGGMPEVLQMRAVKCSENLVVIERDMGQSTACQTGVSK